jgi:YfiH family protein
VSIAPYDTLNLGAHVGDNPAHVAQNRRLLTTHATLPEQPRWLNQVHGKCVIDAETISTTTSPPLADASYSTQPRIVCGVLTADCLPILLCDTAGTWVAAIHAGWRGLAMGVIDATLQRFSKNHRHELLAWLGPAIGPDHFIVSRDVVSEFDKQGFDINETVFKPLVDSDQILGNLYALARQRLQLLGLLPHHITGGKYCTYQQVDDFYSYRRDKTTGRMASLIWRA